MFAEQGLLVPQCGTLKHIREYYALGGIPVNDYARRPACSCCGRSVLGHSFHHMPNGVICHACLYGVPYYVSPAQKRKNNAKRTHWDDYTPKENRCTNCRKPITSEATRCRACAALERERKRLTQPPNAGLEDE